MNKPWIYPASSNSHHQDYYICIRELSINLYICGIVAGWYGRCKINLPTMVINLGTKLADFITVYSSTSWTTIIVAFIKVGSHQIAEVVRYSQVLLSLPKKCDQQLFHSAMQKKLVWIIWIVEAMNFYNAHVPTIKVPAIKNWNALLLGGPPSQI